MHLTAGEIRILLLIATGDSSKTAAEKHPVSKRTIDRHIENMLAKTGLKTRAKLITACASHGIIQTGDNGVPQWGGRYCLPPHIRPAPLRPPGTAATARQRGSGTRRTERPAK